MNRSIRGAIVAMAGLVVAASAHAQVIGLSVLNQISWDSPHSGTVPFSEYADLKFSYTPAPTGLTFVNIFGRSSPTSAPTWLGRNIPLLGADVLGSTGPQETGQVVDLSGLGVSRGFNALGQGVELSYDFSTSPTTGASLFTPSSSTSIGGQGYRFGAEVPLSSIPEIPGLPTPSANPKQPWNGDLTTKVVWRKNMPNNEQGTNQCGPAALANSMHWLAAQHPDRINLNGQTWQQSLAKMKTFTGYTVNGGIGQRQAIEGKIRFVKDATKSFPADFEITYQADAGLTNLGAAVTVLGKTANRTGAGGAPTFDFLINQLTKGADVEVSLDWLNANGGKSGGHVVTIVGAVMFGNKMFVWTSDDADQGAKDANGIPAANGGLRNATLHQVTIENGGYMRFGGFGTNNRIKAIYSEIVPAPGAFALLGLGGLFAARRRRAA